MVNESAILGEPHTGFEKAGNLGEFECGNCRYYHPLNRWDGECSQKDMMEYSEQPKLANGTILVSEEDCCEYVERIGRPDQDVLPEF